MTRDAYHHVAIAIRLAITADLTVGELAGTCGIDRKTAHRILRQLVEDGILTRIGGRGRRGHTYRWAGVEVPLDNNQAEPYITSRRTP